MLIQQYIEMHSNPKRFPGFSIKEHISEITSLVEKHAVFNLLDYGCGKGYQYLAKRYHESWGILPHCYDPGVTFLNIKPEGTFGGVICTDVLEHIPAEEIKSFLTELFSYADKFIFLSIATFPARKSLPNGTNCHVTVENKEWWLKQIKPFVTNLDCVVSFRHLDNKFELVEL